MKQLLPAFLLLLIASMAVQAQPGLVGYYSFCNCNANDNSGLGRHGTLVGAPDCMDGQRGEGFLFNQAPAGNNGCGQAGGEYVQLPAFDTIWANGITICAWVRFDQQSYYERIVDFGNGSGDSGGLPIWFGREGSTNNLALESWISGNGSVNRTTGRLTAVNAIANGSIEYYCATIHQDTMRIYVNGVLKAQKKGHPILNVPRSKNFIGHSNWCPNDPDFKGFMDEVRIYNRALSEQEINNLYVQTPTFAPFQSPVSVGQPVQLQAQGGIAYEWWPAARLSNPNIPNPVATPLESTTFYCKITLEDGCFYTDSLRIEVALSNCISSCKGTLGENIYPNGDFGAGIPNVVPVNPGLAPGYIYQTNPPPNDGYYTIANSTAPWGWFAADVWINIEDNGPEPFGYMMVVNASYPPGMFFQNTVPVCENTLYEFSIDVINIFESHFPQSIKPNLTFMIDSVAYCETGDIPIDEQWHTVRFSFTTAPGQTSVTLGMRNNAPGGYGNDLAIDNISFRACGPEINTPDTLWFCAGMPVDIPVQLTYSPFSNPAFQWQILQNGDWQDLSGANAQSLSVPNPQPGAEYRLLVASATANLVLPHCRVVSKIIRLAQRPPLQVQSAGTDVPCAGQTNGTVQAVSLNGVAPFGFVWSTGHTSNSISGLPGGQYEVTVSDAHGCTGVANIALTEPPLLTLDATAAPVSCAGGCDGQATAVALGGAGAYHFQWNSGQTDAQINGLSAGNYTVTVTDMNGCTAVENTAITEPPVLAISASAVAVSCFGGQNGGAVATGVGGTGGYTYAWHLGQSTQQISGLQAGPFSVTITDANGCTAVASGLVQEPTALMVAATSTDVSCFGGNNASAQTTVSGGIAPYEYWWNGGQTTAQINSLSAGPYSVTITDANSCSATQQMTITQPPQLLAAVWADSTACFSGTDGAAGIQPNGGTAPYQYLWSTGQTMEVISGLPAGLYQVTATDANGCNIEASVQVWQPPVLVLNTLSQQTSCFGSATGALSAQVSGGIGPYSIWWSTEQNGPSIGNLGAGVYQLLVTDANGCTASSTAEVTEPTALQTSVTPVNAACFGSSNGSATAIPVGGTPPYQYLWSNGQTRASAQNLSAGAYNLTATDANGCTLSTQVQITEPTAVLVSTSSAAADCNGSATGTALASASGGTPPYAYLWQTGQTAAQLSGLASGWYHLSMTDAHQCLQTAQIWVDQPPPLEVSLLALPISCPGVTDGSCMATAEGGVSPYQFVWNNGATDPVLDDLDEGTYRVTVTDLNGCTATGSATVAVELYPDVSLGLDQTLILGEEILLIAQTNIPPSEILDYTWSGDGGEQQCPDCDRLQFLPVENGCERVVVHSIKGCLAEDEMCYQLIPKRRIYVPNVFTPDDSGENDFFTIYSDASVKEIRYLKIFSRWGEQLFQTEHIPTNHEPSGWNGTFRGQPMNPGVFVWVAEVEFIDGQVVVLEGDVTLLR